MNDTGSFATSRRPRRLLAAALAALVLASALALPAPAQAQSGAEQAPAQKQQPQRKDNVFGTMDENMRMGRDAETGDVFMRVEPPPPPAPAPEQQIGPIEVHPEVKVPQQNQ